MEILPDDAVVLIFEMLDNDSMFNAMKVCQRWTEVFANSTALLRRFNVEVTGSNLLQVSIPDIPIRNLTLRRISIENPITAFSNSTKQIKAFADEIQVFVDKFESGSLHEISIDEETSSNESELEDDEDEEEWTIYETISFRQKNRPPTVNFQILMEFIEKFGNYVENLRLIEVNFNNSEEFYEILGKLSNLRTFTAVKCELYNFNPIFEGFSSKCHSICLEKCNFNFLTAAKIFKDLQKVKIINNDVNYSGFCHTRLDELLESVKSINNLSLDGAGTSSYFERPIFPFKIEKLDAFSLTFDQNKFGETRLNFLRSQRENLKVLNLKKLPHDFDGGEVLKFIFEDMNLERFSLGGQNLIENGREVDKINEIQFTESQILAGMELIKRFPAAKRLKIYLTASEIDRNRTKQLLDLRTDLFWNIEELTVIDDSADINLLLIFKGLFKNCRNLKKFIINSANEHLKLFLDEILPHFKNLVVELT